ncbi:MAG: hypothetical protein LAP40_23530 [Acidobacteriia bacterium]|nr:hypothetical protein [Terriglobia bacterium]
MSRNLLPIVPPELRPKRVETVTREGDGFLVILECGHKSFWAIDPPTEQVSCSQCLDVAIERMRKARPS